MRITRTNDVVSDFTKRKTDDESLKNAMDFVINKWTGKAIIKSKKYESMRCPSCNTIINYKSGHFCYQCGQKILL